MSKSYRNRAACLRANESGDFRCRHCRQLIGALPSGGRHRNHCPNCLYSRHVDAKSPGDRASTCGSSMAPIAAFTGPKGEHIMVHLCLGCGVQRHNRVAADDDFDLVCALPTTAEPGSSEGPHPAPLPLAVEGKDKDRERQQTVVK